MVQDDVREECHQSSDFVDKPDSSTVQQKLKA